MYKPFHWHSYTRPLWSQFRVGWTLLGSTLVKGNDIWYLMGVASPGEIDLSNEVMTSRFPSAIHYQSFSKSKHSNLKALILQCGGLA